MGGVLFAQKIKFAQVAASSAIHFLRGKEVGRRYLLQALAEMPGASAKVSQLLSVKFDSMPEDSPIEAMPVEQVVAIIQRENPNLASVIHEISPDSLTASLGQLHRVRLKNGEELAVKVQYPNMRKILGEQMDIILGAFAISPARKYGVDVERYRAFLENHLVRELDYEQEMTAQQEFADHYADCQRIKIPRVYPELSTPHILAQEYCKSVRLEQMQHYDVLERQQAAENIAHFLLNQIFCHQFIHTDTHPANFGFIHQTEKPKLVLYDFGSNLHLEKEHVAVMKQVIDQLRNDTRFCAFDALCSLGFDPEKLEYIAGSLDAIVRKMFEPMWRSGSWSPLDWGLDKVFNELLGKQSWWFRTAGPPWFLYFMRSCHGLIYALSKLNVAVDLGRVFDQVSQDLRLSSKSVIKNYGHALPATTAAKHLHVEVKENGEFVVQLQMPAHAVDNMQDLIPESVLLNNPVDIAALIARVQNNGYQAEVLFSAKSDNRSYKVWLA